MLHLAVPRYAPLEHQEVFLIRRELMLSGFLILEHFASHWKQSRFNLDMMKQK